MQDAKASTKAKYKDKNILDSSLFTVKFILMFTVSFIAYDSVLLIVIVLIPKFIPPTIALLLFGPITMLASIFC
jgi:hypothetical protein